MSVSDSRSGTHWTIRLTIESGSICILVLDGFHNHHCFGDGNHVALVELNSDLDSSVGDDLAGTIDKCCSNSRNGRFKQVIR